MKRALALIGLGAALLSCGNRDSIWREPDAPKNATELTAAAGATIQEGLATWYGKELAGRKTASGERFDPNAMTAAHRTIKFGTWVEVTRVDDRRSVRVRITDRGPFGHEERIIDLSREAADRLGMLRAGVVRVQLRVVEGP
jgi:rare lipoprotein A